VKYEYWKIAPERRNGYAALLADGLPPLTALVLSARGVEDGAAARAFLAQGPELLHDPMEMRDMDRAARRLQLALERGETVAVYGDYDVDGITATSLMTDFLRGEGGKVIPYIPDRLEEGYGVSMPAIDALLGQGAALMVTVDCGITAVDEVRYAAQRGMDVVITDHHECKEVLPAAVAVVDPHRSECGYPFPHLAGVGVALKLAMAVAGPARYREILERYADLAAVGTVADVMSLTGENRAIVHMGLEALRRTGRPGLRALLAEAGLDQRPLTSTSIGYTLAPRINASGRMGCAALAGELLLTRDSRRGAELAQTLCQLNRERQAIEAGIYEECVQRADSMEERDALVLSDEGWHQGVVGIVASRLTEKYGVPAFMICLQDGRGKGSCRSWGGFNLFQALGECADLLEGFGGHELAAGFTILEKNIPAFRARMNDLARLARQQETPTAELAVDAVLGDPGLLNLNEVAALAALEPHGSGNPKPVLMLAGCTVTACSPVGGGRHWKLKLSAGGQSFDAIFFSAAEHELSPGDRVDAAFHPQINEYRGWKSVQLQICDLRPAKTRAQAEEELLEKFLRGTELTAAEAQALIPSRQEFARVWRYLRARGGEVEGTARHLARGMSRTYHTHETVMRTVVCLEVFDERGLIRMERLAGRLRIGVLDVEQKVDLEQSGVMRRLRSYMEYPEER